MLKEILVFIKKQIVLLGGVAFGATVASLVFAFLAFTTETDLLDIAKITDLLECYEERTSEK
jgi:hypothetical protein